MVWFGLVHSFDAIFREFYAIIMVIVRCSFRM